MARRKGFGIRKYVQKRRPNYIHGGTLNPLLNLRLGFFIWKTGIIIRGLTVC